MIQLQIAMHYLEARTPKKKTGFRELVNKYSHSKVEINTKYKIVLDNFIKILMYYIGYIHN